MLLKFISFFGLASAIKLASAKTYNMVDLINSCKEYTEVIKGSTDKEIQEALDTLESDVEATRNQLEFIKTKEGKQPLTESEKEFKSVGNNFIHCVQSRIGTKEP